MATAATFILKFKDLISKGLKSVDSIAANASDSLLRTSRSTKKVDNQFSELNKTLRQGRNLIGSYFAVSSIKAASMEVLNVAADFQAMNNAIAFASGSTKEANVNFAFINKTVKDLGLDLVATQKGFKTFSGAMIGTELQGKKAREIFLSVAKASTVMGLSANDQEGVFLALGQMMSKGKVSAEELRGQLGERLPGAFQLAAKSIGVTTAELDKMLRDGKVMSSDFLPKFAIELEKTFSKGVPKASSSLRAQMNRFGNQLLLFKKDVGEALSPVAMRFFTQFSTRLSAAKKPIIDLVTVLADLATEIYTNVEPALSVIGSGLLGAITFVKEYKTAIGSLTTVLIAGVVAHKAATVAAVIYTTVTRGAAVTSWLYVAAVHAISAATVIYSAVTNLAATKALILKGAMAALNFVMAMNPVGLIVLGIAALTAGLIYAWNESETFRNTMKGIWEVIKALFQPVKALGTALKGLFSADASMMAEGLRDARLAFEEMDLSEAFNKPFKASEKAAFVASQQGKAVDPIKAAKSDKMFGGFMDDFVSLKNQRLDGSTTTDTDSPFSLPDDQKPNADLTKDNTTTNSSNSSGRIVTLSIDKIEVNVNPRNLAQTNLQQLGEQVTKVIVGATRDAEIILSSG